MSSTFSSRQPGEIEAGADPVFDYDRWSDDGGELARRYDNQNPFPHIVLDDFLETAAIRRAIDEFPSADTGEWIQYRHVSERKLGQNKRDAIPKGLLRIIDELNSERFVSFLCGLTGIDGLVPDAGLEGGGLHQVPRGGFLNIHADFTAHVHQPKWSRRVNLLVYLNEDWKEEYGGKLELWDRRMKGCVVRVPPVANRCVIFNTDPQTFHGHPEPLACPAGMTRKSIALYYYTVGRDDAHRQSTHYRARPQDSRTRAALIALDRLALRAYDFVKRRFHLDDRLWSRLLRARRK